MRHAALALLLLTFMGPAPSVGQETDGIAAFYGVWEGTAVAENPQSEYFPISAREFDVTVRPAEGGFQLTWGATLRGRDEPFSVTARRREATLHFRKTASPGIYLAGNPDGETQASDMSWARLDGTTLTVTELIRTETGSYDTLVTERTVTPYGLELTFRRFRDGAVLLSATGRAARVGD